MTSPSSGSSSTSSSTSSIDDLMTGMQQLEQSGGGKDLRVPSTATRANYLNAIDTFKQSLTTYLNQATALPNSYGSPGNFASAQSMLWQLQDCITDANNGLVPNLNGYITYLDELEKAVKAAFTRFDAEDKS